MQFYNVKKRAKVDVPDGSIKKTSYGKGNRVRYAVRAVDSDGTHLTKFVSKDIYDKLSVPTE